MLTWATTRNLPRLNRRGHLASKPGDSATGAGQSQKEGGWRSSFYYYFIITVQHKLHLLMLSTFQTETTVSAWNYVFQRRNIAPQPPRQKSPKATDEGHVTRNSGHILSALEVDKTWYQPTLLLKLREAFDGKIPSEARCVMSACEHSQLYKASATYLPC